MSKLKIHIFFAICIVLLVVPCVSGTASKSSNTDSNLKTKWKYFSLEESPYYSDQSFSESAAEAIDRYLSDIEIKSFVPVRILYQDNNHLFLILKAHSETGIADYDIPRILLIMEKKRGKWDVEEAVNQWDDPSEGWETIQQKVCELFSLYRATPKEEDINRAMVQLKNYEVLSQCFPSAGSRPELWETIEGKTEFVYDPDQSADFVCKEHFRVFGVESMDFSEPVFVISLRKTSTINEEENPNVEYFFRNDGDGDKINIVVRVTQSGLLLMKADPWAV